VLPFVNMSGDKEQEYFSDGLAEEIINALTQIPGLKVIARTSSFSFRGKEQDIRRIAEALGVASILEGSVRKAGARIRVTAQLITAADGSHLWSERYDRELNDVFAIQDEISRSIADKLRVQISGKPRAEGQTKNLEAYNLHLKARYHFEKVTPEGFSKSREYCEQAIALDPNYAVAWCDLADYYLMVGFLGIMPPKSAKIECGKAVRKALELDESLPEAHAVSAVLCVEEYDWKGAEREFRRALELNPESTGVLTLYSLNYLLLLRRLDEAITVSRKALDLDPMSPLMHGNLGLVYAVARRWDRALEEFNNSLEIDPHSGATYLRLALMHFWAGNYDEAIPAAEAAIREMGRVMSLPLLCAIYAGSGRIEEAREILEELQEIAQKMYIQPIYFAMIYHALGMTDQALDWYEKAVEEPSFTAILGNAVELSESLRSHPRFIALRRKMNLEP
jgi:TolB-like protein/Tfp pilus assembly protein PilF